MKGKYDDVIVTVDDMRGLYCARGCKQYARRYNLDMAKFLSEGILATTLLALNDEMATTLVEIAAKRLGIE